MKEKYVNRALEVYAEIKRIDETISKLQKMGESICDNQVSKIEYGMVLHPEQVSEEVQQNSYFVSITQPTIPVPHFVSLISDKSALLMIDVLIKEKRAEREVLSAKIKRFMKT